MQMLMDPTALRSILHVDDEPDIRQIVQLALGLTEGLTVHSAESGEQALALARELRPDLLLLDVMMPGLDGPGILKRMRSDSAIAHIPVIFMTAKAMAREIALFRQMGAVGVIAKPFDPMQLSKQVLSLWKDHAAKVLTHA
jgi:CheY-like chemotaxis protein